MKLSGTERETIVLYNEAESAASVYTHNTALCRQLSELCAAYPEQVRQTGDNRYVISVTAIQQTMVTLSKMSMPPKTDFANEPKTYDQIAKCYEKINNLAVEFATTIYSELEYYPDACISSLGRIDDNLKSAQEKVDFILNHPEMEESDLLHKVNMLTSYMDDIVHDAERQIADLNILLNNLKIFKEKNVQTIEVLMKNILDDIKLETTEYQAAEKALGEAKKALEKEVNEGSKEVETMYKNYQSDMVFLTDYRSQRSDRDRRDSFCHWFQRLRVGFRNKRIKPYRCQTRKLCGRHPAVLTVA